MCCGYRDGGGFEWRDRRCAFRIRPALDFASPRSGLPRSVCAAGSGSASPGPPTWPWPGARLLGPPCAEEPGERSARRGAATRGRRRGRRKPPCPAVAALGGGAGEWSLRAADVGLARRVVFGYCDVHCDGAPRADEAALCGLWPTWRAAVRSLAHRRRVGRADFAAWASFVMAGTGVANRARWGSWRGGRGKKRVLDGDGAMGGRERRPAVVSLSSRALWQRYTCVVWPRLFAPRDQGEVPGAGWRRGRVGTDCPANPVSQSPHGSQAGRSMSRPRSYVVATSQYGVRWVRIGLPAQFVGMALTFGRFGLFLAWTGVLLVLGWSTTRRLSVVGPGRVRVGRLGRRRDVVVDAVRLIETRRRSEKVWRAELVGPGVDTVPSTKHSVCYWVGRSARVCGDPPRFAVSRRSRASAVAFGLDCVGNGIAVYLRGPSEVREAWLALSQEAPRRTSAPVGERAGL